MKLTDTNARVDRVGRHNDRNFNVENSNHIDPDKAIENKYWVYTGETGKTFREIELEFYEKNFKPAIDEMNERAKQSHHKGNKTVLMYYQGATRPEDKIIQIGDMNNHVNPDTLWSICLDYQKRFNELYGSNCVILDMALHADETTPHTHARRVWTYTRENGLLYVGQTRALKEMGILPPDTNAPESRFNNPKITFTGEERELLRGIAKEHGIELEPDEHKRRKHLTVEQYKLAQTELAINQARDDLLRLQREREERLEKERKEREEYEKKLRVGLADYENYKKERETARELIKGMTNNLVRFLSSPTFEGRYDDDIEKLVKAEDTQCVILACQIIDRIRNEMEDKSMTRNVI